MAKQLRTIVGSKSSTMDKVDTSDRETSKDGRRLAAKHTIEKHADRVGNKDVPYKSTKSPAEHKHQKDGVYEEVELTELSRKTLSSYVKKSLDPGSEKSISNLASRGGYEYGATDGSDAKVGQKYDHKSVVRSKGVQRAVNKLAREDVELDEAKVADHIVRASGILKDYWAAKHTGKPNEDTANSFHKRDTKGNITVDYTTDSKEDAHEHARNHVAHLSKHGIEAKPRVTRSERQSQPYWNHGVTVTSTKEEVELAELSRKTLYSYATKASKAGQDAEDATWKHMDDAGHQMSGEGETKKNFKRGLLTKDGAKRVNAHVEKANASQQLKAKRWGGAALADDKLNGRAKVRATEEAEPLNELSNAKISGIVAQMKDRQKKTQAERKSSDSKSQLRNAGAQTDVTRAKQMDTHRFRKSLERARGNSWYKFKPDPELSKMSKDYKKRGEE